MRLLSYEHAKQAVPPEIIEAGRELIRGVTFNSNQREDRQLGDIAKACLSGSEGADVAGELCRRLRTAVCKFETNALYHDDLLIAILTVPPTTVLDILFGCREAILYTHEQNKRAIAVYEAAGYRRDGYVRESDFRGVHQREPRFTKPL